jgi:hypothetical protein
MSKKSRKRNRKILKVLAAGLGAAALMRGRKGAVSTVGQPVGVDRMSPSQPPIGGTDHIPVAPKKVNVADTGPVLNVTGGIHADKPAKGMMFKERRYSALNKLPPSMRGGAEAAQGYLRRLPGQRHYKGGWTDKPGGWSSQFKKGGRVKLAKRGLGRAFTKNKK